MLSTRPKLSDLQVTYFLIVFYRPDVWGPVEASDPDRSVTAYFTKAIPKGRIRAEALKAIAREIWSSAKDVRRTCRITEIRYYSKTVKVEFVLHPEKVKT